LWAIDLPDQLSTGVRRALLDEGNDLVVSVTWLWEITLKGQSGKLKLPTVAEYLELNF